MDFASALAGRAAGADAVVTTLVRNDLGVALADTGDFEGAEAL